ncbi:hypothetical protein ACMYSQ_001438 [Aspergillus niger]
MMTIYFSYEYTLQAQCFQYIMNSDCFVRHYGAVLPLLTGQSCLRSPQLTSADINQPSTTTSATTTLPRQTLHRPITYLLTITFTPHSQSTSLFNHTHHTAKQQP